MIKGLHRNLLKTIDSNVALSLSSNLWSILKTPVTIYFITQYLNSVQQGYWYTFLSLGALTVFAEMGYTTIITQFTSHEFAHLKSNERYQIEGDTDKVDKFISLIHFAFRRYTLIIPSGISIIYLISFVFFRDDLFQSGILFPWIVYVIAGGLTLLTSFISAIVQGINQVKKALQVILFANIANSLFLWVALYLGFDLWSLSLASLMLLITNIILYASAFRYLFAQIVFFKVGNKYNWHKEMLPLQIKYSVSWIAGYFIFYFIVPSTMYFLGPNEAGKIGITIAMGSAILQMAHSWVATKMPQLNILISRSELGSARILFGSSNRNSIVFFMMTALVIVAAFYFDVFEMVGLEEIADKFLPLSYIILILIAELCKLILGNLAVHLRAFKNEPYITITIVSAVFTVIIFTIGLILFKSLILSLAFFAMTQMICAGIGVYTYFKKLNSNEEGIKLKSNIL